MVELIVMFLLNWIIYILNYYSNLYNLTHKRIDRKNNNSNTFFITTEI
jgi:hypothetical protein